MKACNSGGPAFPTIIRKDDLISIDSETGVLTPLNFEGMSLRDYFAIHVAVITEDDLCDTMEANDKLAGFACPTRLDGSRTSTEDPVAWVKWCAALEARIRYIKADAMIAEREKQVVPVEEPSRNSENW